MEKRKKVSVILTTHNRIGSLIVAIDSVLNQSYDNIEIIVVNDFDKDNDNLIAKLERYNLKLLHSNSTGANAARLLGFQNSTGHYVSFLDDDDYWAKEKINNQVNLLENNPEAILVTSNAKVFYEDGTFGEIIYGNVDSTFLNFDNFIGGFSFPCIKKEYLKDSYFWIGLESSQDWYVWLKLKEDNPRKMFLQTNIIDVFYQISKVSITKSKDNKINGFLKVFNYLKLKMTSAEIVWHINTKDSKYNIGKKNKIFFFLQIISNFKLFKLVLYILKLKFKK